jgi:hypothetical protein
VTNLTDGPIVIEEFEAQFQSSSEELRLLPTAYSRGHVQGYVADSEKTYREVGSSKESLFQVGPLSLALGATRAYGFSLSFDLYQSGRKLALTDENAARRLLQLAVGGHVDKMGNCRGVAGPVNVTLRLAGGRQLHSHSKTLLVVVGCAIVFP